MRPDTMTPKAIRALRARLGLSQQAIAEKLGVSLTGFANWETGRRRPRGLYLQALTRLAEETHAAVR